LPDAEHDGALAEAILKATAALIEDQGIDAVTMRAVAARVGYSATTIYLHFQDKDELVERSLVHAHDELLIRLY